MKKRKPFNYQLLYRRACLVVYDILSVCMASALAIALRFLDEGMGAIPDYFLNTVSRMLPVNILITLLVFYIFRLYHSLWAFAGVNELQNVVVGSFCSAMVMTIIMVIFKMPIPKSYYFLYAFLLVGFTFASRFSYRFFRGLKHKSQNKKNDTAVMIIGAGEAGNAIIKEIVSSNYSTMVIKCIIDDDPNKWGRYIQGIKVIGGRNKIVEAVDLYSIDEIIVALPSASRTVIRDILQICQETTCKLRSLPGIYQLVNGEVDVSKLRDVEVEDLLGRDPIKVDLDSILGYVKGKVILVTGGGGSIGSELCRQIATHQPKQLIIVDIYENNAYDIQQELKMKYEDTLDLVVLIASIRNKKRLQCIFEKYHPELIYHAAAHKHVPLMEVSPNEAIKNNVFGTLNLVQTADQYQVKRFVQISTDKAVNPTNVMGASKRICEMMIQTFNRRSKTEFVAVRFGNVLGSNGSVIPLFKKQILNGGPVTLTHPDIIRYFMTISEAVSLVLEAGAIAKGGEIFILDMGEPVKIADLAENLIRLSGYVPGRDIQIKYIGLRPGEKLYEELLMEEEGMKDTENSMIHIGKPIQMDEEAFFEQLKGLKQAVEQETKNIREWIKEIVPTYHEAEQEQRK